MKTPGPYEAIVLADSIAAGVRLTTLCCTFPRVVLAEFNTHRVFSRNSASSRAIPVKKRVEQVRKNPYVPLSFGKNKRGMQAQDEEVEDADQARFLWLNAAQLACNAAEQLADLGVHKQWANRLVEPFGWHTVIVTATAWDNFRALRISEFAHPGICKAATAMMAVMDESEPEPLAPGQWHLPLVMGEGPLPAYDNERLVKLCVARTAAVSYERHMEVDVDKELDRYVKLLNAGHMSPFEHAAQVVRGKGTGVAYAPDPDGYMKTLYSKVEYNPPFSPQWKLKAGADPMDPNAWKVDGYFCGNFRAPFLQHRKMLPGEAVFGSARD